MADPNQALSSTQTYAFGVMTQSALLELLIHPAVICFAKGGAAGAAAVTLMTMAATSVFDCVIAMTAGAAQFHA